MSFDLEALEFNKILNKLSSYLLTDLSYDDVINMEPKTSYDDVCELLSLSKSAYKALVSYDDIPLNNVKNLYPCIKRITIGGIITLPELSSFLIMLNTVDNVCKYKGFLVSSKIDTTSLDKYFNMLKPNQRLKNDISYKIDDNGNIKDNASEALFQIRRSLQSLNNRLHSKLNELITSKSSMLTEGLIATRGGHLCLPFKVEYKNSIKGIILDESSSGTTVYIEPSECQIIDAEIEALKAQEAKEIENILKEISLSINSSADEILDNLDSLKELDIIFAKARMAREYDYYFPNVNDKGIINLMNAKHPLIDKDKVVAQDIRLGDKYKAIIITGPNTGGKTVALKTTGLLTIMGLCGMAIPANESSEISIFDDVFVDIGDEQSIEQSLSTFSSHMTKIKYICDNVKSSSLCLIDEIGSGTDPQEGAALAKAIIDYLYQRGARIMVTTHYQALKEYAYSHTDITNASVEFDNKTLRPTYKLLVGVPGKSNAINIAQSLGISEEIIDDAKDNIASSNNSNEDLIRKLDIEQENVINLKKEYEKLLNDYNKKIIDAELYKKKIEADRINILRKAEAEALDIIQTAKDDSKNLLDEIDRIRHDLDTKEHEIADVKFVARNLKTKGFKENVFDEDLKVGDFVFIKSYDRDGQIMSIKKDKYNVQVGQFLMTFDKSDLKLTKPPVEKKQEKRAVSFNPSKSAKLELDLRGYRYEEVKDAIDIFIDKAYMSNISRVYIIHGFGTGVVRDAVQKYLKKSPYVKEYRYGGEGEGLNGVTVVTLK